MIIVLCLTIAVAIFNWLLNSGDVNQPKRIYRIISLMVAVSLVCALAAILLNGSSVRALTRILHADPAVRKFADGDFNWLELDAERGVLFASGHGTNYLLAYDINAIHNPPRKSVDEVGRTQAFTYNPVDQELYVPNLQTGTLLILDSNTLATKASVPGVELGGDTFVVWDSITGQILIASEDEEDGYPTFVIDRKTKSVLYKSEIGTFNLYHHPQQPRVYMAVDGNDNLVMYDMAMRKIVKGGTVPDYLERMSLSPDQSELFVALPTLSTILRVDPETLQQKGSIKTAMGVRTLAVDPTRNLLVTGSLISNALDVIDVGRKSRLVRYHVGPWLRTICLDTHSAKAYVSSIDGLFQVDYVPAGLTQDLGFSH